MSNDYRFLTPLFVPTSWAAQRRFWSAVARHSFGSGLCPIPRRSKAVSSHRTPRELQVKESSLKRCGLTFVARKEGLILPERVRARSEVLARTISPRVVSATGEVGMY